MAELNYTDENIKTLEGVEHIRMRPGMYIGRLGDGKNPEDGIYVMLKEIIDNSIDEFAMGFGKEIRITIEDGRVSVRDFGRGIPLDSLIRAVSILNTGGKFDDKVFKKSVGLNGVGTKAVNALSSDFKVSSFRDGQCSWAEFERGVLKDSGKGREQGEERHAGELHPRQPDVRRLCLRHEVRGEHGQELFLSQERPDPDPQRGLLQSENGLLDLVNENLNEEPLYPPIHLEGEDIEIVLSHCNAYGENIASFVNGQNTIHGGTHLAAYKEAVAKTLKDFFKKNYEPGRLPPGHHRRHQHTDPGTQLRGPGQDQAGLQLHVGEAVSGRERAPSRWT